jgi:hypothetical protein
MSSSQQEEYIHKVVDEISFGLISPKTFANNPSWKFKLQTHTMKTAHQSLQALWMVA